MKTRLITAIMAFGAITASAQDADKKLAVSGSIGIYEYNGEFGNEAFTFSDMLPAFTLEGAYYINKSFDVALNTSFGKIDHENNKRTFSSQLSNFRVMAKLKLNDGSILKEDALIKPYINFGLGLTHVSDIEIDSKNTFTTDATSLENATHFNMPIGIGASYDINERFAVFANSTYNYVGTDLLDGYSPKNREDRDEFFHHAIGVTYKMALKKDSDKDGVEDELDRCPDVVGLKSLYGCPDYDGDGVSDLDDLCPTSPGLADLGGCPDTDGDGISDKDDTCPQEAGTKATGGCPDTDGDEIADHADACPEIAGNKTAAGCPDMDIDGVADESDSCPTLAGVVEKAGCPAEPLKDFRTITHINFGSGSAALTQSAQKDLNDIATILNSNPNLKLAIEGHADADGEEDLNQSLSTKRSTAVREYLSNKGITFEKLNTATYGESAPLVPNNTEAGKARNRRVVVKIID